MIQPNISVIVNTVIMIAAPLDRAVVNIDLPLDKFYRKVHDYWTANRIVSNNLLENDSNTCCQHRDPVVEKTVAVYDKIEIENKINDNNGQLLNDILMISIGGGSRDLIVHAGLSTSVFSDVHVMVRNMEQIKRLLQLIFSSRFIEPENVRRNCVRNLIYCFHCFSQAAFQTYG